MLSKIKDIFNKVAVIIIFGLAATCFYKQHQVDQLNQDLGVVTNNYRYYQELNGELADNNRTLQLTIDELNYSKDSLIQEIKEVQKDLKVKDKNLQQVQVINTEVKDSATIIIKPELKDFNEKISLNELTTITVNRKDSILTAILDLRNSQILFVEEKKEYRNRYKNWFQRFLHFDFKKDRIRNYKIHNSNELIKVTDTRVVEVISK